MESLTLTEQEIIEATGYRRHTKQLAALRKAGIPCDQRPDGTVRVWRHHVFGTSIAPQKERPRPQLRSDRKEPGK
ncbi:DUF4224 domain-containing protein [Paraburkholderia caribensis]|uniref:DUF4224 domain-containing protein n=1 Tax=Paraburkholderia caribensis TaxID=75105 RepID=UPI001CC77610|nr:DUF4224 domain-containing protein [Paraburkholderia caribensis]